MEKNINYKVSLCIPIYNVEKYIERCAVSLFEQTYENIEFIFINDCTVDNSINILHSIINKYPQREPFIKIINHNTNRGLAAARNSAVDASTGEFIMHIDSDDWIDINTVKECVNLQIETNSDIVSVDVKKEWKNLSEKIELPNFKSNKDMAIKMLNGESFHGIIGHLIRTELYKKNNIKLKEGLNMGEDYYIIPRLAYHAERVINLHKYYYHYYYQNTNSYVRSVFSTNKAEQVWAVSQSLKEFFSNKGQEYLDAIYIADASRVYHQFKSCIKSHNNDYYTVLQGKLRSIDKKYITKLPMSARFFLKLKYKPLQTVFLYVASFLKQTYKFYIKPLCMKKN